MWNDGSNGRYGRQRAPDDTERVADSGMKGAPRAVVARETLLSANPEYPRSASIPRFAPLVASGKAQRQSQIVANAIVVLNRGRAGELHA